MAEKDASYRWKRQHEGKIGEAEYAELILTSQTWRDIVWKHQLFVLRPSTVKPDVKHALLFIAGGDWKDDLDKPGRATSIPSEAQIFALLAEKLQTPVAVLLHVPQQPIFGGKVEDQIIALTFENFLKSGDSSWPLLLPMVKSAVRGMDAVQAFARDEWSLDLKTFTVSGASKRGWTTWLTGAVDPRATAIAPMVIDMLNMLPQMKHQQAAWGGPSYKIDDYTERGLLEHLDSEPGRALQKIVDPYSYRQVLKQPKLILLGTNDHYWPLDALNLYWNDLVGEKYILYVPNNRHGLKDYARIMGSINALHQHAAHGKPLPKLDWKFTNGGGKLHLKVDSDLPPKAVSAWVATSPTRDFRRATWRSYDADKNGKGHVYGLTIPDTGYAALFGEATFDDAALPYSFSTNVNIVKAAAE